MISDNRVNQFGGIPIGQTPSANRVNQFGGIPVEPENRRFQPPSATGTPLSEGPSSVFTRGQRKQRSIRETELPESAFDMTTAQLRQAEQQRENQLPELGTAGISSVAPQAGLGTASAALTLQEEANRPKDEQGVFIPSELSQILKQSDPDVEILYTPDGLERAYNPKTGVVATLDKPGVSATDVLQTLGITAAFTPTGRVGLGAGAVGQKIATGAATGAATETAIQGAQAATGGSFDTEDVGTSAVLGGTLPAAQAALGQVVDTTKQLFKNKRAQEIVDSVSPNAPRVQLNAQAGAMRELEDPSVRNRLRFAQKRGIDSTVAYSVLGSSDADKLALKATLKTAKREKIGRVFEATESHIKPLGDTVWQRWEVVSQMNRNAATRLDQVARSELSGVEVDVEDLRGAFGELIDGLGVSFNQETKELDFSETSIKAIPKARDLVRKAWALTEGTKGDAYELHRAKQIIDELITFENAPTGVSGKTEGAVRKLRGEINAALRDISGETGEYARINDQYSQTIAAMNDFKDSAGRYFDPKNPELSREILGYIARGAAKADPVSAVLMNNIQRLESTASDFNVTFKNDILTQSLFVEELEKAMKIEYKPLSEELLGTATLQGARAAGGNPQFAASDVTLRTIRSFLRGSEPDQKALDALERLLR